MKKLSLRPILAVFVIVLMAVTGLPVGTSGAYALDLMDPAAIAQTAIVPQTATQVAVTTTAQAITPEAIVVSPQDAAFAQKILAAINADRVAKGKAPLKEDKELSLGAAWRSQPKQVAANPNGLADVRSVVMPVVDSPESLQGVVWNVEFRATMLGDDADAIGVGYNSVSGQVAVGFVEPYLVGTNYQITAPYPTWMEVAPNRGAFIERINPFDINLLISKGYTEEQIIEKWEDEIFRLTNIERVKAGVRPVVRDASLDRAARWKAEDMGRQTVPSHTGTDGSTPQERADRAGWNGVAAENLTTMGVNPQTVTTAWMVSPPHAKNLLDSKHTHVGIGFSLYDVAGGDCGSIQLFGHK